jgi:Tol biopolymer transport system component
MAEDFTPIGTTYGRQAFRRFFIGLNLLLLALLPAAIHAQTTQVQFGQNRVQYHSFDWQYYNSANFTIYFYPGGQEIGKFVWTVAEAKLKELNRQMDFNYRSQVDILVYNDITDLAQTNIGIGQEDYNIGGTAVLRDNKLFLHYSGNHRDLVRDLMKGLSELYVRQMMSGSSFGQKIQNAFFLVMPEWYRSGLSSYIGEPWNTDLDAQLKLYLQTAKKNDFNRLAGANPVLAGQSFWYMISELYGRDAIPNILYLTRINHSINNGFVYGVNARLDDLMTNWKIFYETRYASDEHGRDSLTATAIKIKQRNHRDMGDMAVSPDGKYAAYASFDGGFYKIFVQDLKTKKTKQVAKGGFRSDQYPFDKSYPILTWTKTGHKLAVFYEKKDKIRLLQIDMDKEEKSKNVILKFQRIHGADFTNNPAVLLISGQNKGQTDLYLYNTATSNITQLNNDLYDDLHPVYVNAEGREGVLFSSNRQEDKLYFTPADTVLPTQTLDLFFYNLNARGETLARVTETPFANEQAIGNYNSQYYTFLSDENGIRNQYVGRLDSFYVGKDSVEMMLYEDTDSARSVKTEVDIYKQKGVTFPITNYTKSILSSAVSSANSYFYFGPKRNSKKAYIYAQPKLSAEDLTEEKSFGLVPTAYRQFFKENILTTFKSPKSAASQKKNMKVAEVEDSGITMDSLYNGTFRYTFESDFNTTLYAVPQADTVRTDTVQQIANNAVNITTTPVVIQTEKDEEAPPFLQNTPVRKENVELTTGQKIRILPYRAKFTSDYVVTQLDNSILTQSYQSYDANRGSYNFPDLGAMINFGVSDLMEDHKIVGGFRIPFNFKGMETYVKYINLKKRIDKSLLYYRRSDRTYFPLDDDFGNQLPYRYTGKTRTNFMEAAFSYPFDITKSLRWSVSYRNERLDVSYTDQVSLKEKDVKENWVSGRLEFVHDNSKEIQFNIHNGFRYKVFTEYFYNANEKKSNVFNIGFDIRHYQKVYRNIIWANRFAGATSFGQQKILYFLGGVDTWLNPKYDYDIPVASNQNYGLQAPVTNMRGLPQNIRNGNNYLLWNSELRIPLFSFFAKKPLRSAFLRDFQLVGFFDAGIAYNFANPFNKQNALSTEVVTPSPDNNPVVVTVNYYRNPVVFGTGGGFRTNILGYFIRLDMGMGYNGLEFNKKPVWHFSLSKDF